jgi:hypothetical protein
MASTDSNTAEARLEAARRGMPPCRCYSCGRNYLARPNATGYCCARMQLTHPPRVPGGLRAGGRALLLESAAAMPAYKPSKVDEEAEEEEGGIIRGPEELATPDDGCAPAVAEK